MKKTTLLFLFFISFYGYSQSSKELIQSYLNENYAKLGLSKQDINDWVIESEASSTSTNINNYYIKQRVQGTEIYGAVNNIWVKNNQVINANDDRFINNASQKINAVSPTLSAIEAIGFAKKHLGLTDVTSHNIIDQSNSKKLKISNGTLDEITANLVYHKTEDNKLQLAWDLTIDTKGHQHLWNVRIDAQNGSLLEQHDMVISCNFGGKPHTHVLTQSDQLSNYYKSFYKQNTSSSLLEVQSGSYRVYPYTVESPRHGVRQLVSTPHSVTASPYGWHDVNGVAGAEFTFTRGNNVWAQEDKDGNNGSGATPNGGTGLLFDFPYGGDTAQPSTYTEAATTNLFYMNNILHDIWHRYGFDESNGNFQQNNYGKATTGGNDYVFADSQDGSTISPQNLNNANFSITPDGTRPRMQMYLWYNIYSAPEQPFTVNSPADIAGNYQTSDNVFSPGHANIPVAPAIIQSDLVLYDDGTPEIGMTDNADACSAAINAAAINGKIAVVRRSVAEASGGTPCPFTEKVKNAQNAGATAVIVVNNVPENISMSGADATITIPAVTISQAVGEQLIAKIKIATVNAKLQFSTAPYVNSDADFDNGIIAHEYGHGISGRLTGGPANAGCLQNAEQMGEGWSDWMALMLLMKSTDTGAMPKTIATYSANQATTGPGIRRFPYSTDMSINPLTFANSNIADLPHDRGEFMATVLWDLTWAYVGKYGFSSDIYAGNAGNNKVMTLAIDAFKLQPCGPSTINYRDALIAADQATTGGQDYCLITEVFTRRGMGLNASSGSAAVATDQVQDFTPFPAGPNCVLSVDQFNKAKTINVFPNPSKGNFNLQIKDFSGNVNISIFDINGREVYSLKNENFDGQKRIQTGKLQTGLYILKLNGENLNHTQKIMIE